MIIEIFFDSFISIYHYTVLFYNWLGIANILIKIGYFPFNLVGYDLDYVVLSIISLKSIFKFLEKILKVNLFDKNKIILY